MNLENSTQQQKLIKFNSLDDITVDNLKFRPIISQIGTYTYNA